MPPRPSTERRLAALEQRTPAGVMTSTAFGAGWSRPWQVGFAAVLTSAFDTLTGYSWERRVLDRDPLAPGVADAAFPEAGQFAFTPANDTTLDAGTPGWLEVDAQAGGYLFLPTPPGLGAGCGSSGSGSGAAEPLDYLEKAYCVQGHTQVWGTPLYQDPCTRLLSLGDPEFLRFEGCCDCGDPPSGLGYDCFNGECVETEGGTYPTLGECERYCDTGVRYDCVDGECVEAVDGEFETQAECQENCGVTPCSGPFCETYTLDGVLGGPVTLTRDCSFLGLTAHWVGTATNGKVYHLFGAEDGAPDGWSLRTPNAASPSCTWQPSTDWDGNGDKAFAKTAGSLGSCPTTVTLTGNCSVDVDCCPEVTLPNTLTFTPTGGTCSCIAASVPLAWDAAGFDGPGWYSAELTCGAKTVQFRFYCETPDPTNKWGFDVYCDGMLSDGSSVPDDQCDFDIGVTVQNATLGDCCDINLEGVVTA